jgi:hypothetical protein
MKSLHRLASLLALALLVLTPVAALASEDGDDKMKTTLIGQLSQDAGGAYVLVEQESGEQIRLAGKEDLSQHVGTQVKVTGEWIDDMEDGKVFRVDKVEAAA